MLNHLKDLVRYVHDTGFVENVLLVVNEEGESGFTCMSKDSAMKIKGKYKNSLPSLRSQKLGVSRMNVLSAYLKSAAFSTDESNDTAPSIDIIRRQADNTPEGIEMRSVAGHKAVFRFMNPLATRNKITVTRSNAEIKDEDILFQPSDKFLKDFMAFAGVLSGFNQNFSLEVDGSTLYMNMGADDTARIPIAEIGEGKHINPTYTWHIAHLLKVLKQAPSLEHVSIGVSEEYGVIEIVIEDDNVTVTYHLNHN